ncbi:putative glycolipid-binding domain-containing protein [Cellulomonas sp. 179-A 4D5 NHS]|uniref:putative glycolipid-binding domain-containing protein n=1 Tax=Cellulomonas sp. 179-A 4D5 NHS TaxID=3142378 RepID=UPI0039A25068
MTPFADPPPFAAWEHRTAREGFEVVHVTALGGGGPGGLDGLGGGWRITTCTTAVEDGEPWVVDAVIDVDATWTTRRARVRGLSPAGERTLVLDADGSGRWRVDGEHDPRLDGCLDVDLESSAVTNALPVHRMRLAVGEGGPAPAVYVRAVGLDVERLEQTYARVEHPGPGRRFAYTAPAFDTACDLEVDAAGLVLEYPGIAVRRF